MSAVREAIARLRRMASAKQIRMLDTGARAPDVRFEDWDRTCRPLTEILNSGPALLAFYKVSCPTCQLAFPFLERIYQEAPDTDVQMFAVSQDDAEATQEFRDRFGVSFPVLFDSDHQNWEASNGFGISRVPSIFLVERDGTISWTMEGYSKKDFESLGARFDVKPFRPDEQVPEWKSG